jgi:hypothetical protein
MSASITQTYGSMFYEEGVIKILEPNIHCNSLRQPLRLSQDKSEAPRMYVYIQSKKRMDVGLRIGFKGFHSTIR